MARNGKSNDPLRKRERELRRQLEQLESDLRRLASHPETDFEETVQSQPNPTRTSHRSAAPPPSLSSTVHRGHFNEQGQRKFDLLSGLRRLGALISGPTSYNRQMIRMLAAGSIDGLPVLRRERKKALLRFLLLFGLLLAILWGIGFSYFRDR